MSATKLTSPILWAWLLGLMGGLVVRAASAGPVETLDREFQVRAWSKEHGLPDNKVLALLQTHDGYLWIATPFGLARFDGITFTAFTRGTHPEIHNDRCLALAEDTAGTLWVGTEVGLFGWDGHRFLAPPQGALSAANAISFLAATTNGEVWAAGGPYVERLRTDGTWRGDQRPVDLEIRSLGSDGRDGVWLGAVGALHRLRPHGGPVERFPLPAEFADSFVSGVATLPDRSVGVLLEDRGKISRFARLTDGHWDMAPGVEGENGRPSFFFGTRNGAIWLGDGKAGLVRWRGGQLDRVGRPWTVDEDFPLCGLEDREGNVWIGTERSGVVCLTRKSLAAVTRKAGLAHDQVRSVSPAAGGGVWAATDGGLSRVGPDLQVVTNWLNSGNGPLGKLKAVTELADGTVWFGVDHDQFSFRDGKFLHHHYPRPPGDRAHDDNDTGLNKVRCFLPARDGSLWLAVPRGLHRLRGAEDHWFTTTNGLGADDVRSLLETRDGTVWAGTAGGGLSRFTGDAHRAFTNLTRRDGLVRDTVWALLEDRDGVLWAGTDGGLSRLEQGRFTNFDRRQGLPEDEVNCLLEDDSGHLWVGHDHGIYRVSRAELAAVAAGRASRVHCVPFGVADGMVIAECNGQTATPAACKTADGRLWFATPGGIVVVDPKSVRANDVAPPVMIERVVADETVVYAADGSAVGSRPAGAGTALRLAPGQARFLEFHFTANTFIAPEKARFRYRLEGEEELWHNAGTRRLAQYIGLPPGRHRLRVVAANHHDVWNEQGTMFAFVVEPFFFQTSWFRAGCVLAAGGALWAFIFWRVRLARRAVGREERARLARSLHDHLGAELASLQSFAELARREIPADHPARPHLKRLAAATAAAGRTLREAIFTLGSGETSLVGLCARITQFADDLLTPAGIRREFDWPLPLPELELPPAAAFELFLALKEALVNVAKHSGASTCRLSLALTAAELSLTVADDGRGFASRADEMTAPAGSVSDAGQGLKNLRAHAAALGGRCQVESAPGHGVTLTLSVPLSRLQKDADR